MITRTQLLGLAALMLTTAGCRSNPFVGTWDAIESSTPYADNFSSATLTLDEDGYALAVFTTEGGTASVEEDGKVVEVKTGGDTFAIEVEWEQAAKNRIEIEHEIDDTLIRGAGWLIGRDTMRLVMFEKERNNQAIEIELQRAGTANTGE